MNLTRESAVCTSGTRSCRPVPVRPTGRAAKRWARHRARSRKRRRWPRWPTRGRSRQPGAPRVLDGVFTRPVPTTGPQRLHELLADTGHGDVREHRERAAAHRQQAREDRAAAETIFRSDNADRPEPGIVDMCGGSRRQERIWQRPGAGTSWWSPPRPWRCRGAARAAEPVPRTDPRHPAGRSARSRRWREGAAENSRPRRTAARERGG